MTMGKLSLPDTESALVMDFDTAGSMRLECLLFMECLVYSCHTASIMDYFTLN